MKILIVNPHMQVGGIASSLVNWLYYLRNNTDHEVDLVVFDDVFHEKYKPILKDFDVILLKKFKYLRMGHKDLKKYKNPLLYVLFFCILFLRKIGLANFFYKLVFKSYSFDGEYDLAISYSNDIPKRRDNVLSNDFVEFSVNAKNKVGWIHNDIEKMGFSRKYSLNRYKDFDFIVNVSDSCKEQFDNLVGEYKSKSLVVSNPLNLMEIEEKVKEPLNFEFKKNLTNFVTVARMYNLQKRIDRLLDVAERLKRENYQFNWYLLGGGPDFDKLKKISLDKGLDGYVFFEGFVQNPYPYVKGADYFILTSDYEAQPVSILESLTLNTPVVSTDFPMACSYIINGENGFTTKKDVESIYDRLKWLLDSKVKLNNFDFKYEVYIQEFKMLVDRCNEKNNSTTS